jgi:alanine racemase
LIPCDVWAEIDLSAIAHNIKGLKALLKNGTRFMAVVKANAYGHGAVETALCAIDAGADALGVARLGEAVELRRAGIDAPILIFGYTSPRHAGRLFESQLTQSIFSYPEAAELSSGGAASGRRIKVHVKIDTGMGRLGIPVNRGGDADRQKSDFNRAIEEIQAVSRLDGLAVEGIYTHFSSADDADKTRTLRQLALFDDVVAKLGKKGVHFEIRHSANSAALIDLPDTHMDMVRAGIAMYGYYPSADVNQAAVSLLPAMTLKSRIIHLKNVDTGFPVSYGATECTDCKTAIASLSIGYADGLSRRLSSRGKVTVRSHFAPIIGRVCMDSTMIDVGHIPGAAVGDEVTVFGKPGDSVVSAEWVAGQMGTISYEVLTGISGRVSRIYC